MEHYAEALQEADWSPELLARRLRVYELRISGVPMAEVAAELKVSTRMCYYDWAAIRQVCAAAGSPVIEEIRAKADARFERLYTHVASIYREATTVSDKLACVREAQHLIVNQLRLYGLIQTGTSVTLNTMPDERRILAMQSDEELFAAARGEAVALAAVLEEVSGTNGNGKP